MARHVSTALYPIHPSVLKEGRRIHPKNMGSGVLSPDSNQAIQELVLEVFADMANAGATLHQTLTAIYLSGVNHAVAMLKEESP